MVMYEDKALYKDNPFYLGSHVGPVAGRIKDGQFEMDGETIQLEVNDNGNHLHGGSTRLDQIFFDALYEDDDRFPALVFIQTVDYDDTDSGYKGQVKYIITMKLVANTLMITTRHFRLIRCHLIWSTTCTLT